MKKGSKEIAVQRAKRPPVSMGSGQRIQGDIFKKIKVTRYIVKKMENTIGFECSELMMNI